MRPLDVLTIAESSKLTALTDHDDERRIRGAERRLPNSVAMRRLRARLATLRDEHVAWVMKVVESPELLASAREVMIRRFGDAMMVGHAATGIDLPPTDAEVLSIAAMAESELEYLKGFAGEAMGKRYRASLYGGGITAAFYRGWLASLPENARIYWRTGISEHCADCVKLEAENPWTKPGTTTHPLWTVPGNAPDTLCGGNCHCHLEAFIGRQRIRVAPLPGLEVIALGNQVVNPTGGIGLALTQLYRERAELLTWYQRMEVADPDNAEVWRARAAALRKVIDQAARIGRHTLRATATLRETIDAVDTAKAHGLRLAKPTDTLTDLLVVVLLADFVTDGKVLGQSASPFAVVLEDGQTYRQDEIGRAMIFVERKAVND